MVAKSLPAVGEYPGAHCVDEVRRGLPSFRLSFAELCTGLRVSGGEGKWHIPGFCSGLPVFRDGLSAGSDDVRRELLSSWLTRFEWNAFFTGTFRPREDSRDPLHLRGLNLKQPISGPSVLHEALHWLRRVSHVSAQRLPVGTPFRWAERAYAALFHEKGPLTGRHHLHALVGGLRGFPAWCGMVLPVGWEDWFDCCLAHSWPWGISRGLPYDPTQGAAHYLTKYSVKGDGAWGEGDWMVVGSPLSRDEEKAKDFC